MKYKSGQLALKFPVQKDCHFDTFVCELLNEQLLHTLTTLKESSEVFILLWGKDGCGKTHLLQALCHQHTSSVYLPMTELLSHSPEVLEGLEQLDLVCLDDVHLLADYPNWQEALFALYNRMREQGSMLVVTANQPLQAISLGLADLHSRLQWGLVFQVHCLSDEGKAKVLKGAAERRGIRLSAELLNYILQRSDRNLSHLFQVLEKLDTLSLIEKRRITQPFIREIMSW